jgi:hypothetical protein
MFSHFVNFVFVHVGRFCAFYICSFSFYLFFMLYFESRVFYFLGLIVVADGFHNMRSLLVFLLAPRLEASDVSSEVLRVLH